MGFYEMHIEGGVAFMSILFILLLSVLATGILSLINKKEAVKHKKWLKINQDLALFALVWGILGQTIGLFAGFQAIEAAGDIPQDILAGGLKISSYPTIYGLLIFLIGKVFKIITSFQNAA